MYTYDYIHRYVCTYPNVEGKPQRIEPSELTEATPVCPSQMKGCIPHTPECRTC
jgi:hypothetical protein